MQIVHPSHVADSAAQRNTTHKTVPFTKPKITPITNASTVKTSGSPVMVTLVTGTSAQRFLRFKRR